MYAALWRILPGPLWVRILIVVALVAIVLTCLVLWVFPWVQSLMPLEESVVGGGA